MSYVKLDSNVSPKSEDLENGAGRKGKGSERGFIAGQVGPMKERDRVLGVILGLKCLSATRRQ